MVDPVVVAAQIVVVAPHSAVVADLHHVAAVADQLVVTLLGHVAVVKDPAVVAV